MAATPILIWDDDREAAGLLAEKLVTAGLDGTVCDNVEQLIAAASGATVTVIACCCNTFTLASLDLLRRFKHDLPEAPVVFYTDRFREVTRLRCLEHGADEFVPRDGLVQTIQEIIELLRGAGRLAVEPEALEVPDKGQMYFQLNEGELSNALQFLCMTSRTGQLVLHFAAGAEGTVYLDRNTIVRAEYAGKTAVAAIAGMLAAGRMEARFFEGVAAPVTDPGGSISQILIEASVMADESKADGNAG